MRVQLKERPDAYALRPAQPPQGAEGTTRCTDADGGELPDALAGQDCPGQRRNENGGLAATGAGSRIRPGGGGS